MRHIYIEHMGARPQDLDIVALYVDKDLFNYWKNKG